MAGADPTGDFVAADFEASIRGVWTMAQSNVVAERPLFKFPAGRIFTPSDAAGRPFDWHIDPDSGPPPAPDLRVLCGVEEVAGGGTFQTSSGEFAPITVDLSFFRAEWNKVKDFVDVDINMIPYRRVKQLPTQALFDSDTLRVRVTATDA